MRSTFKISPATLTLSNIKDILHNNSFIELSDESVQLINNCRNYLDKKMDEQEGPIYGINTGFGSLYNRSISKNDLTKLQENLIKSHACGFGEEVNPIIVKLMLLLKAHALSLGKSGVQLQTVQRLLDMFNNDILPEVRQQGSLGASGDLAPLAHLVLPFLGLGKVNYKGEKRDSADVFNSLGLQTINLKSKEGLALLNGTQFMSAHSVYALLRAKRLINLADITGAISIEAYDGRIDPFVEQLHRIRPHQGQITTANNIRNILKDSKLIKREGKAVQDPYSFRCIPQVHGAVKDTIEYVEQVVTREINSVTDNPTIFPEDDLIVSGGNFHGEPLALVLDFMSMALAELGNISERRVYRLISGQRNLPEFLVKHPGLNSGFMIPQYTSASIVSQNKQLATPASVDSIPSSNEQEDHVSMGANAATKTVRIIDNLERILSIELFAAFQAIEFKGVENTSSSIKKLHKKYRQSVSFVEDDVVMYQLMDKSLEFVKNNNFDDYLE